MKNTNCVKYATKMLKVGIKLKKKHKHLLTQSEERRLELLEAQVVHGDRSGWFGLNLVTLLQQDRQTLAVFLQC